MLSKQEKNRYSRHILLDKVGIEGQEKLKSSSVLVIGAGGLGCPVLLYLTAAGIGNIGIIDFDKVDETNLQRQVLYSTEDIGINKAQAAHNKLYRRNPNIKFDIYEEKLTNRNALEIFSNYDVIVDGSDNFSTRYLVNDACIILDKPLIYGAIYKFEGQVSVFNHENGPSYRCLFPEPPAPSSVPNCSEIGVIGVLPGIIGLQQANEVIKLVLGIGEPLSGKLMTINALDNSTNILAISASPEQIKRTAESKDNFEEFDYDFFCGITKDRHEIGKEITMEQLKSWYERKDHFQLLDVREEWEQPRLDEKNVIHVALNDLDEFIEKIPNEKKVVVACQRGIRSKAAIDHLKENFGFNNLINLKGGLSNW